MMTGVNLAHVPYRGGGPALIDLLGGQVQVLFGGMAASIEHIRAGKLRALAVTTMERSPALPDIPTVASFVPGYEASTFFGLSAPRATPPEIDRRRTGRWLTFTRIAKPIDGWFTNRPDRPFGGPVAAVHTPCSLIVSAVLTIGAAPSLRRRRSSRATNSPWRMASPAVANLLA
jgi:Tripartite tricarboxylate transporter family receptor